MWRRRRAMVLGKEGRVRKERGGGGGEETGAGDVLRRGDRRRWVSYSVKEGFGKPARRVEG